jgi:hypothetical protein
MHLRNLPNRTILGQFDYFSSHLTLLYIHFGQNIRTHQSYAWHATYLLPLPTRNSIDNADKHHKAHPNMDYIFYQ